MGLRVNIFVLDSDAVVAAQSHCDKHICKMAVEYGQLLSTTHHCLESGSEAVYRATHRNHPCAVWARQTRANYRWLFLAFQAVLAEFERRYRHPHAAGRLLPLLEQPPQLLPIGGLTEWVQAMPVQYQVPGDAVSAYRAFYIQEKSRFARWTNRAPPTWMRGTVSAPSPADTSATVANPCAGRGRSDP
jgi:hypothetical protein